MSCKPNLPRVQDALRVESSASHAMWLPVDLTVTSLLALNIVCVASDIIKETAFPSLFPCVKIRIAPLVLKQLSSIYALFVAPQKRIQ